MNSRRAAVALMLALPASIGATVMVMGLIVGARAFGDDPDGGATGYLASALVHLLIGGTLVAIAFVGLRRVNAVTHPDDEAPR